MNELLALPIEAQIVLLAGYLSYQIATIGRAVAHRTEDVILQVVAFGSFGRLVTALALTLASYYAPDALRSETARLIVVGIGTVAMSLSFAMWWRKSLSAWVARKMSDYGIHRDDHESSVWRSLLNADATWSYVQLHCQDGRVFESVFANLPAKGLPTKPLIVNDDGVAMYVTAFERDDGVRIEPEDCADEIGHTIDYFPRSTIQRIEIGWLKGD